MASIKLGFRPPVAQGKEGRLFFRVRHGRRARIVYTDYCVRPEEWDEANACLRITGTPDRLPQLQLLAYRVQWEARRLAALVAEWEQARAEYTADDVVAAYRRMPSCPTWFGFVRGMIAQKTAAGRAGTAKTYRNALASFAAFRRGEDMPVDALDAGIIIRYEGWLRRRGLARNSSSCYLRTLRTLYRRAVDMGLAADKSIFRHVFTGFASTAKRAIPLDAVRQIGQLSLPPGSSLAFARDLFMLGLYLQGMSFVDMAYLRKTDVACGRLRYSRQKTGQCIAIAWEPSMQRIVDTYAHQTHGSPYLLPIIVRCDGTERVQYERMAHNVNRNLKKIGRQIGLQFPLTTYVARHTWASTMRDLGFDLSIVSSGLGHESLRTTQIYLSSIDTGAVAAANREMIDRILERGSKGMPGG